MFYEVGAETRLFRERSASTIAPPSEGGGWVVGPRATLRSRARRRRPGGPSSFLLAVADWTDHNVHDPGVTLLELLAWAVAGSLFAVAVDAYLRRRRDRRYALPSPRR